jgi:hypothetical protein
MNNPEMLPPADPAARTFRSADHSPGKGLASEPRAPALPTGRLSKTLQPLHAKAAAVSFEKIIKERYLFVVIE